MNIIILFTTIAIFFFCLCSFFTINASSTTEPRPSLKMTNGQTANLAAELLFYEKLLNNSVKEMTTQLSTNNNNPNCPSSSYQMICPPSTNVPIINFSNGIPADLSYVQIRPFDPESQNVDTKKTEMCQIANMKSTWLSNFNKSDNRLLFQYFTFKDDLIGFYPASPQNCTKTYTPTQRPFYQSAATGQKDLVILIDVSTKDSDYVWRIQQSKQMAINILKTLSFRDFVAILPYNTQTITCCGNAVLQQATTDNINSLITAVQNIEIPSSSSSSTSGTNIGNALEAAAILMRNSAALGATSKCTRAFVLLSSGSNDGQLPTASVVLDNYPEMIAFTFFVRDLKNSSSSSGSSSSVTVIKDRRIRLATIACHTRGIYRSIFTTTDAATQWTVVNDYFAQLQIQTSARFSQVYTDNNQQGLILSASTPVYVEDPASGISSLAGVVTLDAPASAFIASAGNNLTIDELDSILLANQSCTPLDQKSSTKDAVIDHLQNGTCDGLDGASGVELAIQKAKAGLIVAICVFGLALSFTPLYLYFKKKIGNGWSVAFAIFTLVCFLVATIVLFSSSLFDALVRKYNYQPENFYVKAVDAHPYRCCQLTNCRCQNYYGDSCGSRLANLQEGACNNGYYCCQEESYRCHCHMRSYSCGSTHHRHTCWEESCSTCYRCIESVTNEYCESVCGTCYKPVATVSYDYQGHDETSYFNTQCGLNDTSCLNNFMTKYKIGNVIPGYVDPTDPHHIVESVALPSGVFSIFVAFSTFMGVMAGVSYFNVFRNWKSDVEKRDHSSFYVDKNTWSDNQNNNNDTINNSTTTSNSVNYNSVGANDNIPPPNQNGLAGYPGIYENNNNNNTYSSGYGSNENTTYTNANYSGYNNNNNNYPSV